MRKKKHKRCKANASAKSKTTEESRKVKRQSGRPGSAATMCVPCMLWQLI